METKMTPHAQARYDVLSAPAKKVIDALNECKMEDIEALAAIMMPRTEYVYETSKASAEHHCVMLLQDLQGRP